MFFTQWAPAPTKPEKMSKRSIVSNVPVVKMSARVSQMILTGALVNASNIGYDYQADEKIKDYMFEKTKIRGLDIVDRMDLARYVKEKVDAYVERKKEDDETKIQQTTTPVVQIEKTGSNSSDPNPIPPSNGSGPQES